MRRLGWLVMALFSSYSLANGTESYRVMTLNLHGTHPTDAEPRVVETKDHKRQLSSSFLFYFTENELAFGHRRQIYQLSEQIKNLAPDILFLQEVAGGHPLWAKNCESFSSSTSLNGLGQNSALALKDKLSSLGKPYQLKLACRGNTGWITDQKTFQNQRILKRVGKRYEVVFDFGENPYPNGLFVEGTAILVAPHLKIIRHWVDFIKINEGGGRFFVQAVLLETQSQKHILAFNIHGGHKVEHFEQAVATRKLIHSILTDSSLPSIDGVVVSGDFNATLYRPHYSIGEVSTIGWEPEIQGQYNFNQDPDHARTWLIKSLLDLNFSSYKPWATISSKKEAQSRISNAVSNYLTFLKSTQPLGLTDSTWLAIRNGNCGLTETLPETKCIRKSRIDNILISNQLESLKSEIILPLNHPVRLNNLSDHPGIFSIIGFTASKK